MDPWLQCWCTQGLVALIEQEITEQELESDLWRMVSTPWPTSTSPATDRAMSAKGWTSNKLMLDVGDVAFPPGPKATAESSVPLPDSWHSQIPNMNQHEGYFRIVRCVSTSSSVSSQTQGRQLHNLWTPSETHHGAILICAP